MDVLGILTADELYRLELREISPRFGVHQHEQMNTFATSASKSA